jgi:hypothetical protein
MREENHPERPNYEEEKSRLECEKLKAEIKSIGKPLLKTPGFYTALAPVVLAILGLIFTWLTGWFDVQRTRVGNEKTLVEVQTERLKIQQSTLEAVAQEQQGRVAQVEAEITKLKEHEATLTNQVASLARERNELKLAKELLENETKRLAGSEERAAQFLEQLKSLQAAREKLSSDLTSMQSSNATLRANIDRQAALIRLANEVLSQGWGIALKDKATWSKFRVFGDDVRMVHFASSSYLPEWESKAETRSSLDARVQTYDDDVLTETIRLLERARDKNYSDYIREAEEQFQFLQYGSRYSTNSTVNPAR